MYARRTLWRARCGMAAVWGLVGSVVCSAGLWLLPAQAQMSAAWVAALVEALRQAAPQTGRDDDGLYSDWQIKPANILRWSKRCTGWEMTPEEFAARPDTARAVVTCVMSEVLREQYTASNHNEAVAVQRAAAWWMTGDPEQYNSGATSAYTQKVLRLYHQHSNGRGGPNPTRLLPGAIRLGETVLVVFQDQGKRFSKRREPCTTRTTSIPAGMLRYRMR
jgi:hypothetical protein